ncbi:C78 family peptidase [Aspergillus brunneoviolaceus CBS 621.78]|uniref:DUF1671 domain protein n=1 Tax=Aspergillus brunneoviolaceus CBS 621.78 TaxID=1450534 RepID=A0ACD1GGG3_9EURO|nr:DUF1671 domain protein [Aspergillus brunneoviolaceus CBS 621.78]RAH48341.1 DUF1671 domain protein [Aspergillus brunneoviolaceus CBS 621.78]
MDHPTDGDPTCPFCPFSDADSNFVMEHVESCHPDNDIRASNRANRQYADHHLVMQHRQQFSLPGFQDGQPDGYIDCPCGCGETVMEAELPSHLDLHAAEEIALEEDSTRPPNELSEPARTTHKQCIGTSSLPKLSLKGSEPLTVSAGLENCVLTGGIKRLGRSELGPHANEKRMPAWLRRVLEKGPKPILTNTLSSNGALRKAETFENELTDVISVLARLCDRDKSVQRAFFCSSMVHQISKIPREGGFCGYRNIQMLITYIKNARLLGYECFSGELPTILQLQDMIENAWDKGFNSVGRIETGGIRGTRKYIGTPEAQALFSSLGILCVANSIGPTESMRAHDALFMNVASYFRDSRNLEREDKVISTDLPPIYFQHQGHSMTIVGFEIRDNGSANLLVFDPMFKAPPAIRRLKDTPGLNPDPARILKGYRRGTAYLQKYTAFELLKLQVTCQI